MSSPKHLRASLIAVTLTLTAVAAHATLPEWLQHVVGASSVESALYAMLQLPGVQALYPRPPREAQVELARLVSASPNDSELLSLRALSDEAALDFPAAEADWKQSVAHAKDPIAARLQLAEFYRRRLQPTAEAQALTEIAAAPPTPSERFVPANQQRSWLAYERLITLNADQGLPPGQTQLAYQAFLTRYPAEPAVSAEFLNVLLNEQAWPEAEALIARYRTAFPQDAVFPIRASALVSFRRGNIDQALAIYDRSFQPLWPASLVQSYFALLTATHRQRTFVADARAQLLAHPAGPEALNALARIFYSDQQAGRLDAARQTIDIFRITRDAAHAPWTPTDLATLAALSDSIHSYAEAARYHFALAASSGQLPSGEDAAQAGLSGLIHLLLTAPDQPIALGTGDLTLFRDIATFDQGPGYWNGILSLWLNGTSPETSYNAETAKAQTYFHRAKAAELLTELDRRYPAAPERPSLHLDLLRTYAQYGEAAAVLQEGNAFLAAYPTSPDRPQVGGLMADAYARQSNTAGEFALYDTLLAELAIQTVGQPLSAGSPTLPAAGSLDVRPEGSGIPTNPEATAPQEQGSITSSAQAASFDLTGYTPTRPINPKAVAYAQLLDRYLGRLVATGQLPRALTVLRRQLDANPDDPLLYERLATFLNQNNLSAQQEEVFRLAGARFQQPGWYDRLARLYLRERKREVYAALTRQVTDIFSGTDLDAWFRSVGTLGTFNAPNQPAVGPQLAVQLNLYAQKRFPHDLVFTRNLLAAYGTRPTQDRAAYEDLLRHHWWEDDTLRTEFLTFLTRTGKLTTELAALQAPSAPPSPAANRELAEIHIWTSHFEQAAPLLASVADLYPADATLGDASVSLFRSLAYLDPTQQSTAHAVAIERRLLTAQPDSPDRLATCGDLYAEATAERGEDLASAAPFWRRMPGLHPGSPAGYLAAATIFWDYFQFDDAFALLTQARTHFHAPTLFGYEAGAIEENRHDLPAAIREYTAVVVHAPGDRFFVDSLSTAVQALLKPPSDAADSNLWSAAQSLFGAAEARARLLQLASRPATATLVDQATADAVASSITPTSITLRADVLLAQHRAPELAPLLEQALARASTADDAAAIGDLARTRSSSTEAPESALREVDITLGANQSIHRAYAPAGSYALNAVYEHALDRQIALALDPVQKIELNLTLARSHEDRKDIPGASRIIDAVYRDNPRLLGVVRAATDFYTRTDQAPRAIATLLDAANAANPPLARSFTIEAAQHANDSGNPTQARALAAGLLQQTPFDPTLLAIVSASYACTGDDAGIRTFYEAQLTAVRSAPFSADDRRTNTALLRRGLIPALTRLKEFEGALNQYIALLSAFPEDSATAQEAALYALRYNRQPQFVSFLRTTVQQSPRDSRFAILLAQVDTTFDDLPGALAAYDQAIRIRRDRADLFSARADLELRLNQTEAAAADFERLYLLSYKDPVWMVRLAGLRARQQRPADAVKALETAYITGRPASAANQFSVAAQLMQWNLFAEARIFAAQGIALAGPDLLTSATGSPAATYAVLLTRLGKPDEALATLLKLRRDVDSTNPFPAAMLFSGMTPSAIAELRAARLAQRRQTADAQLQQAIAAIGTAVQTYFTPEQKLAYAQALDRLHDAALPTADPNIALAAATSAGLADREAEWRRQLLLTGPITTNPAAFVALERRRLAFPELARTLEAYAARLKPKERPAVLTQAAQAWRDASDETNELRLTRPLALAANSELRDRFFDLLLRHDRAALTALAASRDDSLADAALNYAIANAIEPQALAAVTQRARTLDPVWRPANAALVLTYFATPKTANAPTSAALFTQALASDTTIATRLTAPADPSRQLTGDLWFATASRFGIFLATVPSAPTLPDPEDFLPADLERAPTAPAPYLDLARSYAEAGRLPDAIAEYTHALELAPNNPAVHDDFAVLLFRAVRHDDALAQWRLALALMAKRQNGEAFFSTFRSTVQHLAARHLFATLRPEVEAVLRPYFARNGNFRSNELLQAVYEASTTPAEGTQLILALATSANDPAQLLEDLHNAAWVQPESREPILLRQIDLARRNPGTSQTGPQSLLAYEFALVDLYLDRNELARADAALLAIPPQADTSSGFDIAPIVLATRAGRLQSLLDHWRTDPDSTASVLAIRSALLRLRQPTSSYRPNEAAIRPLQQFLFDQKQATHTLLPTDFAALAQSRLDTNDLPGAIEVLNRLALQPPSPTATTPDDSVNIDSAAAILEAAHHPAETLPFLKSLVDTAPWNPGFRLRQALAQRNAGHLDLARPLFTALARDPNAPYATRVLASQALAAGTAAADLGSAELTLLATTPQPTPAAARQPYFVAARLAAAGPTPSTDRQALLRETIATDPSSPAATQARVQLLLALDKTSPPSAILALFNVIIEVPPPTAAATSTDEDTVTADSTPEAEDSIPTTRMTLPPQLASLDLATQLRIITLVSAAHERNRELPLALAYTQLAVTLDTANPRPDPALARLQLAAQLDRINATRRPLLGSDLDQKNQVRPRLTAADLTRAEAP